jgi:hypothetical protein
MKNRFKFFLLSTFVLFSVILSGSALAVEKTIAGPNQVKEESLPIATVNIENAQVLSQKNNIFNISFDISNRQGLQTGVKYGVKLISKTKTGQVLVDEKVYDESFTLPENSVTSKNIIYVAPSTLSGTYSLVLFSSNSSGFPFGISFIKEVTLSASVKGLEIVVDSCYLKVEGNDTKYKISEGVDISKSDESLDLTCNVINRSSNSLSMVPVYDTKYHSAYGDTAPTSGGDTSPISFAPSKNGNFSITLPKGTIPQAYSVDVSLKSGNIISNRVTVRYIISGASATVTNLSLDKDYYQAGEEAIISLIWASLENNNLTRGGSSATNPSLFVSATITNDKENKCAVVSEQALVRDADNRPQIKIPVSIMSECFNPTVSVTIKDNTGNTLDQKDFKITTTSTQRSEATIPKSKSILWIIIGLAAIILVGALMKMKKNKNINPTITNNQ